MELVHLILEKKMDFGLFWLGCRSSPVLTKVCQKDSWSVLNQFLRNSGLNSVVIIILDTTSKTSRPKKETKSGTISSNKSQNT